VARRKRCARHRAGCAGGRAGSRRAGGAATLVGDSVGDRLKYPPLDAARALVDDLQCRFFLGRVPGVGAEGGDGKNGGFLHEIHGGLAVENGRGTVYFGCLGHGAATSIEASWWPTMQLERPMVPRWAA